MQCKVYKKRAYTPRRLNTFGEVMHYLVRRGWSFQQEHWHSSAGNYRDEWHAYCRDHRHMMDS
jgi:hypothetical protein